MPDIDITCGCGWCQSCVFYINLDERINNMQNTLGKDNKTHCIAHDDGYYIINGEKRCCKCIVNQIMSDIEQGNHEALSQYLGVE